MSLFGSLFTGVSALTAQSQSMAMISDNIANVNTVGYKRKESSFSNLVTKSGSASRYAPGAVTSVTSTKISQQGLLQQSNSATDIGITGKGFIPVTGSVASGASISDGEHVVTRAGSFAEDENGFLVNDAGFYLLGWPIDSTGALPANQQQWESLQPVDLSLNAGVALPTSAAQMSINLDADEAEIPPAAGFHFSRSLQVYDSLGTAHDLVFEFTRSAAAPARDWDVSVSYTDANGATQSATLSASTLTFDSEGHLTTPATGTISMTVADWGNGSSTGQQIDLNVSGFTQFATDYSVSFAQQNGAEVGERTGVLIDEDGFVTATYTNGQILQLYKVPLVNFANANGLEELSGNVFRETTASGLFNLHASGTGPVGRFASSTLENSNVDLAEEFARMIITQRAYSAGTKVITTSDQMLTELLQLR